MTELRPYPHKVQYYETDKMGIVHHSNYIRWFESARVDFLDQIGLPFAELEARGLASPVLSVSCDYRSPAVFGDDVLITVRLAEYKGVRFRFTYTVCDAATGEMRAIGDSSHCFLADGRPVALKRADAELFEKIGQYLESEN